MNPFTYKISISSDFNIQSLEEFDGFNQIFSYKNRFYACQECFKIFCICIDQDKNEIVGLVEGYQSRIISIFDEKCKLLRKSKKSYTFEKDTIFGKELNLKKCKILNYIFLIDFII